ncbi:MAG: flagellar basal body-associated FliL family protein [Myxococcales bacterium]|nr:flagellar basal body-associated FliL family protein [Myxococcales bacterium]
MAEQEELEKGEQEQKKGGGKKKLIFIAVGAVVLIGAVVGALFGFGVIGGKHHAATENNPASADPGEAAKPVDPTVVLPSVELESFVVNLADTDQNRFLKVTMVVELTKEELKKEIESRKPKVKDAIITLLSGKTSAQVRDSKGKLKLRQEITLRLNEILGTNAVNEILFTEFIIS